MAGSNPVMIVRVAATIEELRRNLAEGRQQIEVTAQGMQRMVTAFNGEKIVAQANNVTAAVHAIGGASQLTAAEQAKVNRILEEALAKYRALGREAPAGMQALAEATRKTESSWSGLLGTATSFMGVLGIGVGVGALASLGRELLVDADALMKLHDKTGISVEALQQMRVAGDEAGVTIDTMADAVNKLQMRLGTGKGGANAALHELGINVADFLKLDPAQQFIAISDAMRQIQDPLEFARVGSELFGKNWAELAPVIKRGFDDVKDSAVGMSRETTEALDSLGDTMGAFWRATKATFGEALADVLTLSLSKTRELRSEFQKLAEDAERNKPKVQAIAPPELPEDLDAIEHALTRNALALAHAKEQWDANEKAMKPFRDAMREIDSAGQGWQGTLDGIDGTIVESIKFYLQAGVAQGALATAYDLTATQVRAIEAALKDESASQQKAAATAAEHARAAKEAAAALDREAEQLTKVKQQAEAAAAAERKAAEEKKALNRAMGSTLDISHAARDPEIMALLHEGWSLENAQAIKLARQWGFAPALFSPKGAPETRPDPSERVPGYAAGVFNAPGGWARVGEHGPETMYVPPGADIYPSSGGAGAPTMQLIVNVTQPLGTPTAIAKAVDAAVMKRLRDIGTRF